MSLKLILIIILNLIFIKSSFSFEEKSKNECKWENNSKIPCIELKSFLPNSSNLSKSGINKTIISSKQIAESGAVDLIDALKISPDINITQSGPKGQQASIFMRGAGSNHTLVLINGIPINDQSTSQGLHDFGVDFLQTISQIEIYPGSSAAHFGTNAIGGAVNIILSVDYKDSISFSTDKNSNYEFKSNKTFLYDKSSLNIKFGSLKNKTISARGNVSDEKDGLKNYSTNINYEKFLNENSRFYNTIYLRQTLAEYDNSNTNQDGYEGDNKMATIHFGLENKTSKDNKNYILYYTVYDRVYDERGTIDTYESEVVGFKYDLSKNLSNNFSMGLGSDYKYHWGYFDNNGAYEASTKGHSDNLSFYGNLGWNIFEHSNISLFLRNDIHKYTGSNNTYKINFDQSFNILNIGISAMTGLRNPTLYEMFGTDNFGYSGNLNLKPEKSNTYEIYSNIRLNSNLNLGLRAFKSNIKDNIEYISNKYQNDFDNIDLNQSGLNTNVNLKFNSMNLNFFSSFLSSKKENNSDQLRRPNDNYGFNFNKKILNSSLGNFNINLSYNHFGKHFDTHSTNFSTIEMDSIDLIDLKIMKKLNKGNIFFKINNLLAENYQKPHGYNQDKRSINFGYKF